MHKRITYNLMYDLMCICYVIFYLNRIYKDLNSSVFRRSFPSNMHVSRSRLVFISDANSRYI